MSKIGYIYAIDNSVYIGLTTKTIKERYAQHLQAARSNRASCILHLFMAKHGPENFTVVKFSITHFLNSNLWKKSLLKTLVTLILPIILVLMKWLESPLNKFKISVNVNQKLNQLESLYYHLKKKFFV